MLGQDRALPARYEVDDGDDDDDDRLQTEVSGVYYEHCSENCKNRDC